VNPMTFYGSIVLFLGLLFQNSGVPSQLADILNFKEKAKLDEAHNANDRIKVYRSASERIQQTLEDQMKINDFEAVPGILRMWTRLLDLSLEDINSSLQPKKKPKNLKKFEIHLRKAIKDLQSEKIKAPVAQQEDFDAFLARAESVRNRFVEILFQH
jgi:hypothetical protein